MAKVCVSCDMRGFYGDKLDCYVIVYLCSHTAHSHTTHARKSLQECGVEYTPYAKTSATRASLMQPEEAGAAVYADLLKLKDRLPHALQQVRSFYTL